MAASVNHSSAAAESGLGESGVYVRNSNLVLSIAKISNSVAPFILSKLEWGLCFATYLYYKRKYKGIQEQILNILNLM
ncbi:MAG: hypothetical protein WCK35_19830 [Chloroflexota bacterium]